MKSTRQLSFILLFNILFLTGCSVKTSQETVDMSKYSEPYYKPSIHHNASLNNTQNIKKLNKSKEENNIFSQSSSYVSKKENISNNLLSFYKDWEGTKYRLGGTSKKGIDCSSFVQLAMKNSSNVTLPRSTKEQINIGKTISKNELQMGDLVFFKTGRTNHVGIYIEDGKFMHASTKIGVTISELDNTYFKKNYWKAQRIIK
jgi:cell wall-associated NlpC family hydrolase